MKIKGEKQSSKISQHRMRLKLKSLDYSGNKCMKCNYNSCINNMVFHHINPHEKECRIASGDTRSWDHLKKKLDKTILFCCRCHGELHAHLWGLDDLIEKQRRKREAYVDKPLVFYKDDVKPNSDFCNNRYKFVPVAQLNRATRSQLLIRIDHSNQI